MALINNYYVFIKDESVKRGVSVSSHPVESGLSITDNVRREPMVISISGEIVGTDATKTLDKLTALHQKGELVKYIGQNVLSNAIISSFDTDHPNTIYGGCSFSMEIKEIRIAKSPLVVKKANKAPAAKKQVTNKSTGKFKAVALTADGDIASGSTTKSNSGKKVVTTKGISKKYKVKRGDTLWDISKKYYGSGAKYTKIVTANKKLIKNPNRIQAGWTLTIPA